MSDTWSIDIRHYGENPASLFELPAPARRLAQYFGGVIFAATVVEPGVVVETALRCRRRPGRRPCPGHLIVSRHDVPPQIRWNCSHCDDNGYIRGWRGTGWDLYDIASGEREPRDAKLHRVLLTEDEYLVLWNVQQVGAAFDMDTARIIYGAITTRHGVEISGSFDDLDYFLDCLAAEANHEKNSRKRKALESVYDQMQITPDGVVDR